jgi:hypothetical protein
MASTHGQGEDLKLRDEDADSVLGGKKKKKKPPVAKKPPVKKAIQTTWSGVTVAPPRELTRDEMIAANADAVAHSTDPLYDIPDLPAAVEE